jgi:hypothetical protein
MDRFKALKQQCSLLIKASLILRRISVLVREGEYEEAEALRNYYKGEIEPLLSVMNPVKRN